MSPPKPLDAPKPRTSAGTGKTLGLGLVFLGGTLGTAAREMISFAVPAIGGFPLPVFLVNVIGALLLGALLEYLTRCGPDAGWRLKTRLFAGTGFMGGFTTYSTFATAVAQLTGSGSWLLALVYAVGTVVIGALATIAGIKCSAAVADKKSGEAS